MTQDAVEIGTAKRHEGARRITRCAREGGVVLGHEVRGQIHVGGGHRGDPGDPELVDSQGVGTILNDDASGNTWGDFYVPRDGSADAALFNPASGLWTFKDSNTGNVATFGPFGDTATYQDGLVPADYTGDGITDCASYRPSTGIWTIVRPVFRALFREVGLPDAIRTDNGAPFASTGIHGLSSLNVWWMQLGIVHQRIAPASPQQNGQHERMQRELKRETARPAGGTAKAQQRRFNAFRRRYNDERPQTRGLATGSTTRPPDCRP